MNTNNKLVVLIASIIIGLLLAITAFLYFQINELRSAIENRQVQIDSLNTVKRAVEVNGNAGIEETKNEDSHGPTEEQSLWEATKRINTFSAYLQYLKSEEGDSLHHKDALDQLFDHGSSGWLYSGRTSNDSDYSNDQLIEVVWRKDGKSDLDSSIPQIGDIVTLKSLEARRTYPNFLPRSNQNGIWPIGKSAYVIDTRMEGKTALIIKIVYERS
jgi:hypothetical protein